MMIYPTVIASLMYMGHTIIDHVAKEADSGRGIARGWCNSNREECCAWTDAPASQGFYHGRQSRRALQFSRMNLRTVPITHMAASQWQVV